MTHENRNFGGGAEHPGSDEQKISEMLTSLKRVEAPKDFDFHLKARIAKARPADYHRASLWPMLKYTMPLALFLVVGASVFVYNSYNTASDPTMVAVPEHSSVPEPPQTNMMPSAAQPQENISPGSPTVASANPETPGRTSGREDRQVASARNGNSGGSRDFGPSREVVPPGNFTDLTVKGSAPALTPRGVSLKRLNVSEALKLIDAEASFENGFWTVRSVAAKGVADQIGMKAGDKVKAVDGKPVGEHTEFESTFSAGVIQVQRGEATVDLGLNRKPNHR